MSLIHIFSRLPLENLKDGCVTAMKKEKSPPEVKREMLKAIAEYAKHDRAEFVRVVQEAPVSYTHLDVYKRQDGRRISEQITPPFLV